MRGAAIRLVVSTSRSVYRITHARANPDFSVDLRFEDGRQTRVNLSEVVQSAAVAEPFRDPVRFVRDLTIVEDGDVLRWSNQFELHADSLRYRAFPDELVRDYGPQRGAAAAPRLKSHARLSDSSLARGLRVGFLVRPPSAANAPPHRRRGSGRDGGVGLMLLPRPPGGGPTGTARAAPGCGRGGARPVPKIAIIACYCCGFRNCRL
jgi:hypothetical protein